MKKVLLILFLLNSIFAGVLKATEQNDTADYLEYYLNNTLVRYTPIKDCLVINYVGSPGYKYIGDLLKELNLIPITEAYFDPGNIFQDEDIQIYNIPVLVDSEEYDGVVERLKTIDWIRAVCGLHNKTHYVSRFVGVQIKNNFSEADVEKITKELNLGGYVVDPALTPMGKWFELETTTKSVDPFTLADILYSSGMCERVDNIDFSVLKTGDYYDSVTKVETVDQESAFKFYNLQGQLVETLVPGIYIKKDNFGKAVKIVVK
ncbi:MAG: hypothetical protein MJY79_07185 [Bacteroidaceae bacterium]|nr:hypothetical protein [Bacteroidaceae bacterium]